MKTCLFTGHRIIQNYAEVRSYLREEILNKINSGVTVFIAGGAMGFDTMAAELVIEMRDEYHYPVELHLYLPCYGHDARWRSADKRRNAEIVRLADRVLYVTSDEYEPGCMERRNAAMVSMSDCGIAYLMHSASGSHQTVRMALQKGIDIVNIAEKAREVSDS